MPETGATSPLDSLAMQHGYALFYLALVLGAGMLAYGLWNNKIPVARRIGTGGLLLLVLMASVALQVGIDRERGSLAEQDRRMDEKLKAVAAEKGSEAALKMQYLYMPEGDSLVTLSLNNPCLAADYVWLTSLQYVSNSFRRGEKFDMLSRFYKTMIDLDPKWISAEISGGKVLSALIEEREKAEECYIYAMKKNPGQWRLFNEGGMLFVMPPRDPHRMKEYSRKAADWFDQALKQPNLPDAERQTLADHVARLRLETGGEYYRQAEELLYKNATDPSSPESLKEISRRDWLKAHSMAQAEALSSAAQDFKKKRGVFPPDAASLLALMSHPEMFARDAFGFTFDYDPATGEATSHGAKALQSIQAGHVVDQIIQVFKQEKKRYPADLEELRAHIQTLKQPPFDPPTPLVIEAIGIEKDPTRGPLGPWNYDPVKGRLIMPPESDAKALYGHVKEFFPN